MRYKDWVRLIRKRPSKALSGRIIAYDIDGKPLGEIVYRSGLIIAKHKYAKEGDHVGETKRKKKQS